MAAGANRRRPARLDRGAATSCQCVGGLRLQLLGGFEFLLDECPLRLPLSAQRVVAFLALHPRPVQRIYVASNLWPDSTEERAHASLRTALWRLGVRGFGIATATTTELAFVPSVYVDVHDAAARAKRLIHWVGPPDPHDLARLCDVGEVLPDWMRSGFWSSASASVSCACTRLSRSASGARERGDLARPPKRVSPPSRASHCGKAHTAP
jgi:hypothetical protein